jgi:hypothetical protein
LICERCACDLIERVGISVGREGVLKLCAMVDMGGREMKDTEREVHFSGCRLRWGLLVMIHGCSTRMNVLQAGTCIRTYKVVIHHPHPYLQWWGESQCQREALCNGLFFEKLCDTNRLTHHIIIKEV